jgi:hypothetical protein
MFRRLPVAALASNWTSLLGVVLVTGGAIFWLKLLPRNDTAAFGQRWRRQ